MLALKYGPQWRLAGVLLFVLALTGALLPEIPIWDSGLSDRIPYSDKGLHIFTFAFLAVWLSGQYAKESYWRIIVGLFVFGVLIEIVQGTLSYRIADWKDLLADGLGIVIGLVIALLGAGGWSLRLERMLET